MNLAPGSPSNFIVLNFKTPVEDAEAKLVKGIEQKDIEYTNIGQRIWTTFK